ncbi:MAG TPA: transporter [Elusimicrobiota bacterium]|nr:transporter [Elusimicrobiota bacterium]
MKKKWLSIAGLAAFATLPLQAQETFVTETVSMVESRTVALELRPGYRTDLWKVKNTNTEVTDTLIRTDVNARWSPMDKVEVMMEIPYLRDTVEQTATADDKDSGLGQVILGGKYAFCPMGGAALRVELPTGDKDKMLGEGLNIGLALLAEKAVGPVKTYANVGYLIKQEYKTTFDVANAAKTKVDPGDILQLNLAAVYPRFGLDWVGEANMNFIGKQKRGGTTVSGSDATGVALLVGANKKLTEQIGVKAALSWEVSEEAARSVDTVRGSGDYKVTLAANYRFKY